MNILNESFNKVLQENEDYETFCQRYRSAHDNLISDLKTFSESLELQILVPVCSRVLMKGKLIHTNEVMVSLGCGYFTKCTVADAQQICLRRIKKVEAILEDLEKERNFVESRIKFSEDNVFSTGFQEIIESYDEAKENNWRKQHATNMKKYRNKENREIDDIDHEEIMNKLELLELQEEIEEMHSKEEHKSSSVIATNKHSNISKVEEKDATGDASESKEFILRKRLADLRQRKKTKCTTEEDIFKRLNELEEEEEIEDELDRLYDEIYGGKEVKETASGKTSDTETADDDDDIDSEDDTEEETLETNPKDENDTERSRRVSFANMDNPVSKTVSINFKHSSNDWESTPSESATLVSPSDIYKAFPQNFKQETKSIIKNCHRVKEEVHNVDASYTSDDSELESPKKDFNLSQHIILGNIVEHSNVNQIVTEKEENQMRPESKFKSMRKNKKQS